MRFRAPFNKGRKIPFEVIKKENPNLPAGQEKIITPGVEGERTHYISVLTENGKQTETVLDSLVTQEAVTQVIEVGKPLQPMGTNTVLLQPQKQNRDWTFKRKKFHSLP